MVSGLRRVKTVITALITLQIVRADPLPPGEPLWMAEVQLFAIVFVFNLTINSAILAAVLKAMRLKLKAKFALVAFILTLGGLLLDSAAARISFGNALTLYFMAFALMAPYAALLVKLAYRTDSKKAVTAGIVVGLISNPGIFALLA